MPKFSFNPSRMRFFKPVSFKKNVPTLNAGSGSVSAASDKFEAIRNQPPRYGSLRDLASVGRLPFHRLNERMTCGDYNL